MNFKANLIISLALICGAFSYHEHYDLFSAQSGNLEIVMIRNPTQILPAEQSSIFTSARLRDAAKAKGDVIEVITPTETDKDAPLWAIKAAGNTVPALVTKYKSGKVKSIPLPKSIEEAYKCL